MSMAHPELPAEQAYLDEAYDCLDRMRAALLQAAEAGSSEVAAEAIEAGSTPRAPPTASMWAAAGSMTTPSTPSS
jgi:hypothetical protein